MANQTSQPRISWGFSATVNGLMGSLSLKMVAKTDHAEHLTREERDAERSRAIQLLYEGIITRERLAEMHQPQIINGELYVVDPIQKKLMIVRLEPVLIVE